MSGTVVPFPERDPGFKAPDPSLLLEGAISAKKAALLLSNPNVTDAELEETMKLLNDAWGVAAAFFLFRMGEF